MTACGGAPASGAPDAGAADASTDVAPVGQLFFYRDHTTTPSHDYFSGSLPPSESSGCTPVIAGACERFACPLQLPESQSAGTLTLTTTAGTLTVDPKAQTQGGGGYLTNLTAPGFQSGDALGVAASGAAIDAFGPVQVTAPGAIDLVAPQATASIATGQDLVWTWSGGEPGATVVVQAIAATNGNAAVTVECTLAATAGTVTMPAALLAPLAGSQGQLGWGQLRSVVVVAGTYPIELGAAQLARANTTFTP